MRMEKAIKKAVKTRYKILVIDHNIMPLDEDIISLDEDPEMEFEFENIESG